MNRGSLIVVAAIACATLCPGPSAVFHAQSSTPAAGQQPPAGAGQAAGRGRGARGGGGGRETVRRTLSPGPDLGYGYDMNPLPLPAGMEWAGHVSSVAINSKGHIYVFHRAVAGKPQIMEFDQNQKFVRSFGEDIEVRAEVIYQYVQKQMQFSMVH